MVNITRFFKDDPEKSESQVLPLLPLRDIVLFPHMVAPLFVGRPKSVAALSSAMNTEDKHIFLATQNKAGIDNPTEKDIHRVGVIGTSCNCCGFPTAPSRRWWKARRGRASGSSSRRTTTSKSILIR
jgi:ATP-dependent Lon protease